MRAAAGRIVLSQTWNQSIPIGESSKIFRGSTADSTS